MKLNRRENAGNIPSAQDGFTLIELIVVVMIIGLLSALVVPKFFGKVEQSKLKAAQAQIELLGAALDQYRLDMGQYPTTSEGLDALRIKNATAESWHGPYLKKEIPKDPWGHPFIYKSPGEHEEYDIVSYGADGASGGEDEDRDIVSWKGLD